MYPLQIKVPYIRTPFKEVRDHTKAHATTLTYTLNPKP